jgi:hypothetical protein
VTAPQQHTSAAAAAAPSGTNGLTPSLSETYWGRGKDAGGTRISPAHQSQRTYREM